jgi:hypothetical protein
MPIIKSWYWKFLHPIEAIRIHRHNKIICEKLRLAALEVCERILPPDKLTDEAALEWFETELKKAFFKVLGEA